MTKYEIITWLANGAHTFNLKLVEIYRQVLEEFDKHPERFDEQTRRDAELLRKRF